MAKRDEAAISEISYRVYCLELGEDAVARMIAADKDGGIKLRKRAAATKNASTVRYMRVLGLPIPMLPEPAPIEEDQAPVGFL